MLTSTETQVPETEDISINNLFSFFPRAANFFHPFLVTAPIGEIIGKRGVAAAGLVRTLRHGGRWFDSSRSDAWRSSVRRRKARRRHSVAHLAFLVNVRDTRCRALSSRGTVPQAGSQRRQARVSIAMGISQLVAVS